MKEITMKQKKVHNVSDGDVIQLDIKHPVYVFIAAPVDTSSSIRDLQAIEIKEYCCVSMLSTKTRELVRKECAFLRSKSL